MRLSLKAVNEELAHIAENVELAKAGGYFLFRGGESDDWIDRTVAVPTINSLTLNEWIGEYRRLKALNQQIMIKPRRKGSRVRSHERST